MCGVCEGHKSVLFASRLIWSCSVSSCLIEQRLISQFDQTVKTNRLTRCTRVTLKRLGFPLTKLFCISHRMLLSITIRLLLPKKGFEVGLITPEKNLFWRQDSKSCFRQLLLLPSLQSLSISDQINAFPLATAPAIYQSTFMGSRSLHHTQGPLHLHDLIVVYYWQTSIFQSND